MSEGGSSQSSSNPQQSQLEKIAERSPDPGKQSPIPGACSISYQRNVSLETNDGSCRYWGEMENGVRHGKGTTNGVRHGKGTTVWHQHASEHSGVYANGLMDGPVRSPFSFREP